MGRGRKQMKDEGRGRCVSFLQQLYGSVTYIHCQALIHVVLNDECKQDEFV